MLKKILWNNTTVVTEVDSETVSCVEMTASSQHVCCHRIFPHRLFVEPPGKETRLT